MIKSFFKIAWRNLIKSKLYSFINIGGLAVGMAVAILIGLWIYDEVSYNKYFKNYDRVGKLWQFVQFDAEKTSYNVMPIPLAEELRTKYPDFKEVSLAVQHKVILGAGDKNLSKIGNYVQPSFVDIMSVKMLAGNVNALTDINSIMVSNTLAKSLFGQANPIGQIIKINNKYSVKVAGIYEDFPANTELKEVMFLAPWDLYTSYDDNAKNSLDQWDSNSWEIYAQLKEGADFKSVSAKIKDIRMKKENPPRYKPEFFIHPMSKWHLYGDFRNGENVGGLIQFVWLFGIIGIFVLLLACINFMNLGTARSEKRAKEVGIRKAIGSARQQLIVQFLSESLLVAFIAFILSLILVQLALPFFNDIAGKQMKMLWLNPLFWLVGISFSLLTGLIAGSYPALYLSSFNPVKVLKGTFRTGRFATMPRKALVVLQFTVSVTLIIGTIVVFRQVQYAKNRPVGYSRHDLVEVQMASPDLARHFGPLRADLLATGAVSEVGESTGSITVQYGGTTNISWRGKTHGTSPLVMSNSITHEYGKTVGWQLLSGRDFSRTFSTDSASMILNEAAVELMGFKDPLNEFVKTNGREYKVIGVISNMIKESPFRPVSPSFFILNYRNVNVIALRLAPQLATRDALGKIEAVFKKYNPESPFDYKFVDEAYGHKFSIEERIGKLATSFAVLAIFISCLGLFGLASFVAEQRTKEIGVRKVLGATVFNLWQLLSKEFVALVLISFFIAGPVAWYVMHKWLQNYLYRTEISWWIFAIAGMGALLIAICTVSYQGIKAAVANPVKSLRSE